MLTLVVVNVKFDRNYIFVYISKDYIPATIKRIGLTESSFQYAIKHPQEYPQIKPVYTDIVITHFSNQIFEVIFKF
jgi:hypothetical protein